jgi:hypothetical protein
MSFGKYSHRDQYKSWKHHLNEDGVFDTDWLTYAVHRFPLCNWLCWKSKFLLVHRSITQSRPCTTTVRRHAQRQAGTIHNDRQAGAAKRAGPSSNLKPGTAESDNPGVVNVLNCQATHVGSRLQKHPST